jgi:transposase
MLYAKGAERFLLTKHTPPMDRDPAVPPSRTRSTWTATEHLALLADYATVPRGSAARGAFVRRNGLDTSQMSQWRAGRDRGAKAGRAAPPRGPKPAPETPLLVENGPRQQELARVQARLPHAEAVIEIQKKERSCLARGRSRLSRASCHRGWCACACPPHGRTQRLHDLGGATQPVRSGAPAHSGHAC